MTVGMYRIKDGWGNQDSVRVRYNDGNELELPEDKYIENDYKPHIYDLKYNCDHIGENK